MKTNYVTCALCGHQFPESLVRQRGQVECACGMRIDRGAFGVAQGARHTGLTLAMLAIFAGLVTAGYMLTRRLLG